ncbi:uncharacterized protein LOC143637484 [Bidens hawaiensis]|uniref:uncharacterized protein LOC143637484 n=1 Tax=Bidens hawaiensis TaxID=980011 RepID=UPI00404AF705
MMTGLIQDQNLEKQIEKQIGCISGFLHIFDRQQILAGKRVYSTKRLTSSPESVKSVQSTASSREIENPKPKPKPKPVPVEPPSTPARSPLPPSTPPRSPLPLPIFELKDGSYKNSWKFCKEMPRLSLDSRATVDSKGSLCAKEIRTESLSNKSFDKQQRSPSVIARLMGLGELPSSQQASEESIKKPELRRSASESRVSRELFNSRFKDGNNANQTKPSSETNKTIESNSNSNSLLRTQKNEGVVKTSQWRLPQQRRSFFDSGDVFPETKQTSVAVYDTEKTMKLRGIDEQTKDLETLKHILEAMQFKGLLHFNRPVTRDSQRNFAYDDSNLVHTKPWRSGAPNRGFGSVNRYSGEISPSVSPRKDRGVVFDRSGRSPVRGRNSPDRSGNSIVKRTPLSIETERRMYESSDSRRNSPINSLKLTPKRSGSDMYSGTNRSPRSNRLSESTYSKQKITRNILLEDESSSISESSGSTTSHSDLERSKTEENRKGKSLLARCDKLLHSIAEMNSITESHTSFNSVIPSPVSVLDSAFDKDESSSPSPVMKRTIDFKDVTVDTEDDIWRSIISSVNSTKDDELEFGFGFGFLSDDYDFKYISRMLRVPKHFSDDSSAFNFLEKQYYRNEKGAKLKRKLVFDVVTEIINEKQELPPWKTNSLTESDTSDSAKRICSELEKIREADTVDNLLDLICNVLKKDLAGNNGWVDQPMEVSEAVLYIERLIFKDLVSETIRDLADFAGKTMLFAPRRKLVF